MSTQETKPKPHIWIGPTIVRFGVRKNMIVKGNKAPVQLQNLIDTKPMYRSLFIRTDVYPKIRTNLNRVGSIEHRSVQEIKELVRIQALHKGIED
jgi:hypothetical protein